MAVALVAAALSVSGATPASADHGRTRDVWSATLTVGNAAPDLGFDSSIPVGALSNRNIRYAGVDNGLDWVLDQASGTLLLKFFSSPSILKSSALTLHVGNRQFALADATLTANELRWSNAGLSWSAGDTVQLKLTGHYWTGVDLYGGGMVHGSDGAQTLDITSETGSATFLVRLDQAPTANVTITLQKNFTQCSGCGDEYHGDVNAVTVSPTTLTFTPSNYGTGQSVTVTGVADSDSVHDHVLILAYVSIAGGANSDDPYRNPERVNGVWVTVHDGSDDGSSHGGL